MDEEFAFHREHEQARLEREGWSPRDAHAEAERRFGDPLLTRELCHAAMLGPGCSLPGGDAMTWTQDLRSALRGYSKQPGLLAVLVLTAAVGIGATTAVFSVVSSVLLNPLPYPEPDRLVRLYSASTQMPGELSYLTGPDFRDYRDQVKAFAATGAFYDYRETGLDLTGLGPARRTRALAVSAGYFEVLGATPLHGRLLSPQEENGGEARFGSEVVILSHHLWQQLTGGDPEIVGQQLELDGISFTVIGILRPTFLDVLQGEVDLWIPLNLHPEGRWFHRQNFYLSAIARLAPEASVAQAQAQADSLMARIDAELEADRSDLSLEILPLFDDVVGSSPTSLGVLFGAAVLVLMIAAINIGNLLVARGLARSREMAVRSALGSGRIRLARQLLLESSIATALGGIIGGFTAYLGVKALLAVSPDSLARSEEVSFDPRLLLFGLAMIGVTTLLCGLAPALQAAGIDPAKALRGGSRGGGTSPARRRLRAGLVASQIALAAVLLVGTGVLLRSFAALHQVPLQFDPQGVLTFEINTPTARYPDGAQRDRFHRRFQDEIAGLPGVVATGAISKLPALGPYNYWGVTYVDDQGERQMTGGETRIISGDYFGALGIPLLRGRQFDDRDGPDQQPVVIINQEMAEQIWPGQDPLGKVLGAANAERTVIGVVADVPFDHLGSIRTKYYVSHRQFADDRNWALTQVVKTTDEPLQALGPIQAVLQGIDTQLVLHHPAAFESLLDRQRAAQQFVVLLMVVFAIVALTLAVVGIYGVLAYTVTQQRREIGLRVALGAQPNQVLGTIMRQGLLLATIGTAIGLPAAWASSQVLDALLFEVKAQDPWVFAAVGLVLAAVTLAAAMVPARQALEIEPMAALRED